jgi:uncharacterized integral membrane protein
MVATVIPALTVAFLAAIAGSMFAVALSAHAVVRMMRADRERYVGSIGEEDSRGQH